MKKANMDAIISANLKDENILSFTYKDGKGKMEIDLFNLLPCTAHDFKILLDTIQIADDAEKTATELYGYIRICIDALKDCRALLADHEKKDIASVTNEIKRYLNLAEKAAKRFDFEPITDVENVKTKKVEVITMLCIHGEPTLATFPGKRFEKGGYVFHVYKEKGRYKDVHIILPYCGVAVTSYSGPVKDATAYIDQNVLELMDKRKNQIDEIRQQFLDLLADRLDIIPNDDINVNPWEKPKTEPEITRPVKEEIVAVVNAPAEPKKNRIPRNAARLYITYLVGGNYGKTGDAAIVNRDEYGDWIATDQNGKRWSMFASHLRDGNIIQIDRIETTGDIERQRQAAAKRQEMARRAYIVRMLTQSPQLTRQEPQRKTELPYKPIPLERAVRTTARNGTPLLTGKLWISGNMNGIRVVGKWHDTS